jgi:hypothetical protein
MPLSNSSTRDRILTDLPDDDDRQGRRTTGTI